MEYRYWRDKIIKAKVTKIWKNVIYLETKDKRKCYLNINDVSDYHVNLNSMFKINSIKEVIVLTIDRNNDLIVSYKNIHPKEIRNPFVFKLDKNNAKFDAILDFTLKGIRYGK